MEQLEIAVQPEPAYSCSKKQGYSPSLLPEGQLLLVAQAFLWSSRESDSWTSVSRSTGYGAQCEIQNSECSLYQYQHEDSISVEVLKYSSGRDYTV